MAFEYTVRNALTVARMYLTALSWEVSAAITREIAKLLPLKASGCLPGLPPFVSLWPPDYESVIGPVATQIRLRFMFRIVKVPNRHWIAGSTPKIVNLSHLPAYARTPNGS